MLLLVSCQPVSNDAVDRDHDGFSAADGDCDDAAADSYPGAEELCGDGVLQDCRRDVVAAAQWCAGGARIDERAVPVLPSDNIWIGAFGAEIVAPGDVDGDGRPDVGVVAADDYERLTLLYVDVAEWAVDHGTVEPGGALRQYDAPASGVVTGGDANGDGLGDVIVAGGHTGDVGPLVGVYAGGPLVNGSYTTTGTRSPHRATAGCGT